MKNYKLFKVGDKAILRNGDIGDIKEVHCSYCKIEVNGSVKNYTYAQFKKYEQQG